MELEYHNISLANINAESKNLTNDRNCCFFSAVTHFLFYIVELREFLIENKHKFENNILLNLITLFELLKNPGTPPKVENTTMLHDKSIYDLYSSIQQELFIKESIKSLRAAIKLIDEEEEEFNKTGTLRPFRTANFHQRRQDVTARMQPDMDVSSSRDSTELLNKLFKIIDLEISKCLLIPFVSINDRSPIDYLKINLCLDIPFYNLYYTHKTYTTCNDDLNRMNPLKHMHIPKYNLILNIEKTKEPGDENPTIALDPSKKFNISLQDTIERVTNATDNHEKCNIDVSGNEHTIPNSTHHNKYIPNKYIIISLNKFRINLITGMPKYLPNEITGINENIICDRFDNKYKIVGAICYGPTLDSNGDISSGHYWYKKLNTTDTFDNYNDTSPKMNPGEDLNTREVVILLFRKIDEPYRIPYLDENKINRVILTNLKLYKLDEYVDNDRSIKMYIELLVFYTNIYNSNYYLEFHELLCDVYDHLCCQIEYLLKANDEELCKKISYHLKALVYLANKYNICEYKNQLLIDLHEYIKCEIEKLIELI